MSSKVPTVKQTAWISLLPHLLIIVFLIGIYYLVNPENAILFGVFTYLILSFSLRRLVPKDHRNGIIKNNVSNFREAISDFEKSYFFFKKHEWVDKYRYITLLSSSKISYREMALNNIAFCYGQIGNVEKSKEYYLKTLNEFPESGMAKVALNFINSIENGKTSND